MIFPNCCMSTIQTMNDLFLSQKSCSHVSSLTKNNISPFSLLNLPIWLTGAKRREFSGMIRWLTINFIIPATPSNPSIPSVKCSSKLGGSRKFSWDPWDAKRCTRVTFFSTSATRIKVVCCHTQKTIQFCSYKKRILVRLHPPIDDPCMFQKYPQ